MPHTSVTFLNYTFNEFVILSPAVGVLCLPLSSNLGWKEKCHLLYLHVIPTLKGHSVFKMKVKICINKSQCSRTYNKKQVLPQLHCCSNLWEATILKCLFLLILVLILFSLILYNSTMPLFSNLPTLELIYKESWVPKNWCFWTGVLEKILESPLDSKEIQSVHPKGNQSWIFIGKTDAEAETPILWSPDGKNWLTLKDPDAEKDWRQQEKGKTEDEMVGWHHWLNGHEFE